MDVGHSEIDGEPVEIYTETCDECDHRMSVISDSPEAAAASLFGMLEWHHRSGTCHGPGVTCEFCE